MTAREIAKKTWELWNDYYKEGDLGSKEILDIIENDIKALTIPAVISTVCDCEKKVYEPLISGEVKCLRCGKMIAQTDL